MGVREGPFTRPRQLKVLKFSPRPVFDAQYAGLAGFLILIHALHRPER